MPADDVSLKIQNRQLSGWTDVQITRGVERCPSEFDIAFTEEFPGDPAAFVVQAGDACQILIDTDLVLTGYVDRVEIATGPAEHPLRIKGRSKCADLVDCSAEWPGCQISGASALNIAQKLATPYGIKVSGLAGKAPPTFPFMIGETPMDIIERVTRNAALLAYDQPDGNLLLARVGTTKAASGFTEGKNVQGAKSTRSADQRYSEYDVFLQSMDTLGDLGSSGNLVSRIPDPNTRRHRKKFIISEQGGGGRDVAIARGHWEAQRNDGRSRMVSLTADSWRDVAGTLWTPNTLAPLSLPIHKIENVEWVIGEVSYRKNGQTGTTVDVTLMPPAAFLPEPVLLQPFFPDVAHGPFVPGGQSFPVR